MRQGIGGILFFVIGLSTAQVVTADSLFNPDTYRSVVSDRRAAKVGDVLTVAIYENATAQSSAGTTAEKSGGTGVKVQSPSSNKAYSLGMDEDFSGKGRIERSGKLLGTITVVVESVEPNGDLNVKGEQLIELNEEKQAITLQGRVRPVDIQENNTVVSSKVANARISYIGEGFLASRQRPGIFTILLSLLRLL